MWGLNPVEIGKPADRYARAILAHLCATHIPIRDPDLLHYSQERGAKTEQ